MKKNNKKIITIAILLVAVVGLSVGFAAFSSVLTIRPSATVTPNASTFNVDFSASSTSVTTTAITPTVSGATATNATISNSGNPTISNLAVTFTEPGQTATYSFYAYNAGEYTAYLNAINFANATGQTANKVCTAGSGTTAALVKAACEDITITVKVGDTTATATNTSISGKSIAKAKSHTVTVTIAYAAGGDRADGDFTVAFGDISLTYGSAD